MVNGLLKNLRPLNGYLFKNNRANIHFHNALFQNHILKKMYPLASHADYLRRCQRVFFAKLNLLQRFQGMIEPALSK
ncbi:MAG: hypothetical protein BAA00_07940 [Parageobacillus thermoglucosidasius]|nr:MAG: hypothetical protein BAA00_07940 [Parageobacillus thermoglucosidasius]